jgi:hypothetical protein
MDNLRPVVIEDVIIILQQVFISIGFLLGFGQILPHLPKACGWYETS